MLLPTQAALQFLKLEYLACLTLIVLSFLLLWFLSELGSPAAITFLVGAVVSLAAGVAAIIASTRLSSRITYSSKFGLAPAFRTAYQSASAIAFSTVSLHLLGTSFPTQPSQSQPTSLKNILPSTTPAPNTTTTANSSKASRAMGSVPP